MVMSKIVEKFAQKLPVAVMAHATLERAFAPAALDALFLRHAERQYDRALLFSSAVSLMALVVCGEHPSVRKAYAAMREELPVSLTAVYAKLGNIEVGTCEALVAHSAATLAPIIDELGGPPEPWLPGRRIKVLDGNHIAATERRLAALRGSVAGPLPGLSLVVLEPETGLATQMVGCEDGHAQERTLLAPVLTNLVPRDVLIADRNFCTLGFLSGVDSKGAGFVIRQHASMPLESAGTLRAAGAVASGTVHEQDITLRHENRAVRARRVVVRLATPTRDGDVELAILTNLSSSVADAQSIASLYARRWTIESLFARIERNLKSEIASLGYPGAALFAFAVALTVSNVFAVVQAALRAAQREQADAKVAAMALSEHALVEEMRTSERGMVEIVDEEDWEPIHVMPSAEFARFLVATARHAKWHRYEKSKRGPKVVRKRTRFADVPHVSTAKLLGRA